MERIEKIKLLEEQLQLLNKEFASVSVDDKKKIAETEKILCETIILIDEHC